MYECTHEEYTHVYDRSSGDRICTGCGTVLESFVFDECIRSIDEDRYRVQDPAIDSLCDRLRIKLDRVQKDVRIIGSNMKLSESIVSLADDILLAAFLHGLHVRESFIRPLAAAALYYACKLQGVDRAELEMALNCGLSTSDVSMANKRLRRVLAQTAYAAKMHAPTNPVRLIPRFMEVLSMPPEVISPHQKQKIRSMSEDLGARAIERGILEGKSSECCCISFIYASMLKLQYSPVILDVVCERCGLTPSTILNALSLLETM